MRYIFILCAMMLVIGAACADVEPMDMQPLEGDHNVSPGTFIIKDVSSPQACKALCKDQKLCRGYEVLQPDTRKQDFTCYLNDGRAEGSPFAIKPPAPFDEDRALRELNAYRAGYGLGPVVFNAKLTAASLRHAKDLAKHDFIAHEGSDGSDHAKRAEDAGYDYRFVAENVATGQLSWEQVFKGWKNSPGHNKNLLHKDVTEFGIAFIFEPDTQHVSYWAMLVGSPQN